MTNKGVLAGEKVRLGPLTFLIVEDHPIVVHGLRALLTDTYAGALIAQASTAQEALELILKKEWDLVILDITLSDVDDLELLKEIKKHRPSMPVLVLSGHSEEEYAVRVLRDGAAGYLMKGTATSEMLAAISRAVSGGKYITSSVAELLANEVGRATSKAAHETLSDRELQVLKLVAKGYTAKEIADTVSLSIKTVQTYRERIHKKIGLTRASDLTRYVLQHGLDN